VLAALTAVVLLDLLPLIIGSTLPFVCKGAVLVRAMGCVCRDVPIVLLEASEACMLILLTHTHEVHVWTSTPLLLDSVCSGLAVPGACQEDIVSCNSSFEHQAKVDCI
jgi:hypothetical protein